MVSKHDYSKAADVYSFGIILWEMMTWRLPWEDLNPFQVDCSPLPPPPAPPSLFAPSEPPYISCLCDASASRSCLGKWVSVVSSGGCLLPMAVLKHVLFSMAIWTRALSICFHIKQFCLSSSKSLHMNIFGGTAIFFCHTML